MLKSLISNSFLKGNNLPNFQITNLFHVISDKVKTSKWLQYNEKIYPPQAPDEKPRPAFVCHEVGDIKYSYKKLWYIASFIRGMSIDEALKQLQFIPKKGAVVVRDALLEAQKMAVYQHNVEFKSNLWVSESFVGKHRYILGVRRGARKRFTKIRYKFVKYFVTLEEGEPPKEYYFSRRKKNGEELLEEWLQNMRKRKVINSL